MAGAYKGIKNLNKKATFKSRFFILHYMNVFFSIKSQ